MRCIQADGKPGHGEAAGGAGLDADTLPPGGHHTSRHPLQYVFYRYDYNYYLKLILCHLGVTIPLDNRHPLQYV